MWEGEGMKYELRVSSLNLEISTKVSTLEMKHNKVSKLFPINYNLGKLLTDLLIALPSREKFGELRDFIIIRIDIYKHYKYAKELKCKRIHHGHCRVSGNISELMRIAAESVLK